MASLFSRPPTDQSKCETWTWLFPNLSWTTDGIIYHHCPKIRSKEEKGEKAVIARHSQNYGCCRKDIWDQDIWTGFLQETSDIWLAAHQDSAVNVKGFVFKGGKSDIRAVLMLVLFQMLSISTPPDSMAHSRSRYLAFLRLFENNSLTREVVSKREFFWQAAHISATLCAIVSPRWTHCRDCGTQMTSQPANLCPTWLSVNTPQSEGFEPAHGDSYKRTEESASDHVVTVQLL